MRIVPKGNISEMPEVQAQLNLNRPQEGNLERLNREMERQTQKAQETQRVNDEDIRRIMEEIKRKFDMLSKYLRIDIDQDLEIPVAKIIERETNKIIRQIPPDYLLDLMKKIDQMLEILVKKEA